MTPDEQHVQMIYLRRLARLVRIKRHRQDGHGNQLDDAAMRMVEHGIEDAHWHATFYGVGVIADIAMGKKR